MMLLGELLGDVQSTVTSAASAAGPYGAVIGAVLRVGNYLYDKSTGKKLGTALLPSQVPTPLGVKSERLARAQAPGQQVASPSWWVRRTLLEKSAILGGAAIGGLLLVRATVGGRK